MGSIGAISGLISAAAKLEKWVKLYLAGEEARKALAALEVGGKTTVDIPDAAEIHFSTGVRRYALDIIGLRRLPDKVKRGKKA